MEGIEFAKGHGTGNDFVIVPDPAGRGDLSAQQVAALCDRRYGIGGDGLLRVVRAQASGVRDADADGAQWFMDYRNADGSVAEMCGNGVRVYARYLVESGLAPAGTITVGTRTGPVRATVTDDAVTVAMRRPRIGGQSVATAGGSTLVGTVVDCGNPHLVARVPDEAALAAVDFSAVPRVDARLFPTGVNVEVAAPLPAVAGADVQVRMRVHERGVGETLSCGSGACAVAAAALRDLERDTGTVTVQVPGGTLQVALSAHSCELTGPAVVVARGKITATLTDAARAPVLLGR